MKRLKKQAISQEDGERKAKLALAQVDYELLSSIIMSGLYQLDNTTDEPIDGYLLSRRISEEIDHLNEINKKIEKLKGNATTARSTEKSNGKCVIKRGGKE